MSTFSALSSPLLRQTWICRACIRSQRQTIPQRSTFGRGAPTQHSTIASRIGIQRTFATQVEEATNAGAKNAGKNSKSSKSSKSSKRQRRLLITGGGLAIGAGVVTINDDAKHAYVAAQRSYRVAATLVLNIREYVKTTFLQKTT
jgi:aarF domain-containing kinase